jgi:hypothetical protein
MFVHALAALAFHTPDSAEEFYRIEQGFLGNAPDWIALDPYFDLCVHSGVLVLPMASAALLADAEVGTPTDIRAAVAARRAAKLSAKSS